MISGEASWRVRGTKGRRRKAGMDQETEDIGARSRRPLDDGNKRAYPHTHDLNQINEQGFGLCKHGLFGQVAIGPEDLARFVKRAANLLAGEIGVHEVMRVREALPVGRGG